MCVARHEPVLRARAARLVVATGLVSLVSSVVASSRLWLLSRRCSCRRTVFAAALWLRSRSRGGRCNLYALMCCSVTLLSLFCEYLPLVPFCVHHE